jgi:hypothetical protein
VYISFRYLLDELTCRSVLSSFSSLHFPFYQVRREPVVVESSSSLQERIDAQGAAIRELKQGEQGLGNKDPQVKSAVAELLRLKSLLEEKQQSK